MTKKHVDQLKKTEFKGENKKELTGSENREQDLSYKEDKGVRKSSREKKRRQILDL